MSTSLVDKKIFLIASASAEKRTWIEEAINAHVNQATIYTAKDGLTALSKLQNAPPHVVITDVDLPKVTKLKVVEHTLASREAETTAIIITGPLPDESQYLDELVTGKIQYFTGSTGGDEFNSMLMKALNFTSKQTQAEFYLRFLAPGDVLLKEGDKAEHVYFVKKGQLQAYKMKESQEVALGKIEYGEFVGEMAYINGEPRNANVKAVTNCELIEVPLGTFEQVLFKRPAWSKALMVTLAKRIKAANQIKKDLV